MKKVLSMLVLCISLCNNSFSQNIAYKGNQVSIDTSNVKHPIAKSNKLTSSSDSSAKPNFSQKTLLWLEEGDGHFTTDPFAAVHTVTTKQNYSPLLVTTYLYDTTRNPPPRNLKFNNSNLGFAISASSSFTQMLNKQGVKITPSVNDLVPGDTMVFALTYKTFKDDTIVSNTAGTDNKTSANIKNKTFKLYFFYNNNIVFNAIKNIEEAGHSTIKNIRTHFEETVTFKPSTRVNKLDFTQWICCEIPKNDEFEKTIFINLTPLQSAEIGKSGSVYAVLTDESDNMLATDKIDNMLLAPSHDPNYLVQRPVCLKLPKKVYPFEYKVHFQNTGEGAAVEAKVIIHVPAGLNYNSFKVTNAQFAGANYTPVFKEGINMFTDKIKNTITVVFNHNTIALSINKLQGTATCVNPTTNILTMGEIGFTIESTTNTADTLAAYADILFKSEYPSLYAVNDGNGYEDTVTTNKAVAAYKNCCTCTNTPIIGCFIILGLCWWWWLVIAAAIGILYIIYKKSKKNNKQQNITY